MAPHFVALKRLAQAVGLVVLAFVLWAGIDRLEFPDLPPPLDHLESLNNPVQVSRWDQDGLLLADGRKFQLPGFVRLPEKSSALLKAVKNGIEIDPAGRVYCLIPIHHWCGNDPIRTDLRRIDLARLLQGLGEGKSEIDCVTEPKGLAVIEKYRNYFKAYSRERRWDPGFADLLQSWQREAPEWISASR